MLPIFGRGLRVFEADILQCINDDLGHARLHVALVIGRNCIPWRPRPGCCVERMLIRIHVVVPIAPLDDIALEIRGIEGLEEDAAKAA